MSNAGMEDFLIAMVLFGFMSFFIANWVLSSQIKGFVRRSDTFLEILFRGIVTVFLMFTGFMFFLSINCAIIYQPPPPINLVFWGLDKGQDYDYSNINNLIKVTNSRVVLFGEAKNKSLPIENVIGSVPPLLEDYDALRTWFHYNKMNERNEEWNAVAVFGLKANDSNIYINFFKDFNDENKHAATRVFAENFKGVFEMKVSEGVVCSFETKNSKKTSGWRPLPEASNIFQGL